MNTDTTLKHVPAEQFNEISWQQVIASVEHTYSLLAENQQELESKNASLQQAQRFLSSVLASMTDALLVSDENDEIVQCNPALEKILALSEADLVGQPYSEVFAVDSDTAALNKFEDYEINIDIDGTSEPFSLNCSSRYDQRGRFLGRIFVARPLSEIKKAYKDLQQTHNLLKDSQEQLLESEKMASLGRLISGIVHEINNPISFVYGNIFVLQDYLQALRVHIETSQSNEPVPEQIQDIFTDMPELTQGTIEGLERTESIIKGLRSFSSIHKKNFEPVNLVGIINTVILWTQKTFKRDIRVDNQLPTEVRVYGNAGRLHQLFANLLHNAFRAMSESDQPVLTITCDTGHQDTVISICDNGVGIDASQLDKIFDPFYSTQQVGGGMGLGLYISYNIAREHQGHLRAKINKETDQQARGMTFQLTLPIVADND